MESKAFTQIKNRVHRYNKELFAFIADSPTPFHAAATMAERLEANGFTKLREEDPWQIKKKKRYYVIRNTSAVIAFITGEKDPWDTGINIACAHTDSPCLRVKPFPEKHFNTTTRLGVEVYGSARLTTWFDRGLNLAGRVTCLMKKNNGQDPDDLTSLLINFKRPVAVIPSLAIHLDRDANNETSINPQIDISPLFYLDGFGNKTAFKEILFHQAVAQYPEISIKKIIDFEMSFSCMEPPGYSGLNNEFILGSRLDNLISCHAVLESLIQTGTEKTSMIVCTDHEEIGSGSLAGASGSFLESVLNRITGSSEKKGRTAARSMMISWDNAHAAHPCHGEKHDGNHLPQLNKGPVLKINSSLRYASNSESSAVFKTLCAKADIPFQTFVMRSDMPCGSTTGPILSARTGIRTVDAGAPSLAMHSISELCGAFDPHMIYQVNRQFFTMPPPPLLSLT